MSLQPLTAQEFGKLKVKDPNYYTGRWPYLEVAMEMAMEVPVEKVLELGPYRRPLYLGCDIMDRHNYLAAGKVDLVCDASKTPWPVEDSSYDLFVALQVWEHLGTAQAAAFKEVQRVAKRAVLSFPFEWKLQETSNCHHNVTAATIAKWTGGIAPVKKVVVSRPDANYRRMVCLYVFD